MATHRLARSLRSSGNQEIVRKLAIFDDLIRGEYLRVIGACPILRLTPMSIAWTMQNGRLVNLELNALIGAAIMKLDMN